MAKKFSFPLRLWRVVYPILIWFGIRIAVELFYFVMYGMQIVGEAFIMDADALFQLELQIIDKVNANSVLITGIADLISIAVLLIFYIKDKKKVDCDNELNRKKVVNFGVVLTVLFTALAFYAVSDVAVSVIATVCVEKVGEGILESSNAIIDILANTPQSVMIVSSVLIGPICEELIFRGLFFKRMRAKNGFWLSAIISSLVFGFVHGNFIQFLFASTVGIALASVYEMTDNFAIPVLVHMLINLTSFTVELDAIYPYYENALYGNTSAAVFALSVIAVVTGTCAIYRITKQRKEICKNCIDN